MSLNKTLDRLFDEIRREAKRNPEFADRLDAVLRLHESRRDVPDETLEQAARSPEQSPQATEASAPPIRRRAPKADSSPSAGAVAPALNPAGLYKRAGEPALAEALMGLDAAGLRALVAEHNLDPAGATSEMDQEQLVAHILTQARRRAERDDKMFDY